MRDEHYDDLEVSIRFTENAKFGFCSVEFFVAEIEGLEEDGTRLYVRERAGSSFDTTTELDAASRYIAGCVKWDGCSNLNLGEQENDGYLHLCGKQAIRKLTQVIPLIYQRCFKLMQDRGTFILEDEIWDAPTPSM